MIFFRALGRIAVSISLCLAAAGCLPSSDSQVDEEKEPNFLEGRRLVTAMDFKVAAEAFDQALKVNPNSAAAHYELGCLYDKSPAVADPAAAIYHYEHYLKLRPKAENADLVKGRINGCKLELAKTVSALPLTPAMQRDQREYEKLLAENRDLKAQLARWQAYFQAHPAPVTPPPPSNPPPAAATTRAPVQAPPPQAESPRVPAPTPANPPAVVVSRAPAPARTYTVKQGDIPYTIAKKHGISVGALLAANPQLNPRRMQVGQTLSIPAGQP